MSWEYREERSEGPDEGCQLLGGLRTPPQGSTVAIPSPVSVGTCADTHLLCSAEQLLTPIPHPGLHCRSHKEAGPTSEAPYPEGAPILPNLDPSDIPGHPTKPPTSLRPLSPARPSSRNPYHSHKASGGSSPPLSCGSALTSPDPRLLPSLLSPSQSISRSQRPSPGSQGRLPALWLPISASRATGLPPPSLNHCSNQAPPCPSKGEESSLLPWTAAPEAGGAGAAGEPRDGKPHHLPEHQETGVLEPAPHGNRLPLGCWLTAASRDPR